MTTVSITRDKTTKEATLSISATGKWVLYAGYDKDKIDYDTVVLEAEGSGIFELDIPNGKRSYFVLKTETEKTFFAENLMPMEGAYNFRDLGGFPTQDGLSVKWGVLFRSDDLMNLTDADLEYLEHLSILSIVDFRTEEEVKVSPDRLHALLNTYWLPLTPGNLSKEAIVRASGSLALDQLMEDAYIDLVSKEECIDCYHRFFEVLSDPQKPPVIFHCSAGKDRTGVAAALLLLGLGVSEELVMANYLESNGNLHQKYSSVLEKYPQLEPMFSVKQEYLQYALDYLKNKYGSVENYLKKELKVDLRKLKNIYLFKGSNKH